MLPSSIILFNNFNVNTIYLFTFFGVLMWAFVIWYEGQKDGFNSDKTFDISFWVLTVFIAFNLFLKSRIQNLEIYEPQNWLLKFDKNLLLAVIPFILSLSPVLILSKRWKWSVYRLLDILAHAYIAFSIIYLTGLLLVQGHKQLVLFISVLTVSQYLILKYRGYKIASGLIFSIMLILTSIGGLIFYNGTGNLLFYMLLFTIGVVTLYFRGKKSMIFNTNIPNDLLKALQAKLTAKEKQLKSSQQQLAAEDAFLNQDRTMDNAEVLDEAILEDNQKELTDVKISAIKSMRIQVRKALGFMKIGKYGICEICGVPIDKARLRVYPEATKCIDCANKENI